jgi:hypothetical protein
LSEAASIAVGAAIEVEAAWFVGRLLRAAAHAQRDHGADLQQPEADRLRAGAGELAAPEREAAQRLDEHVGEGGEPQAQLVDAEGVRLTRKALVNNEIRNA